MYIDLLSIESSGAVEDGWSHIDNCTGMKALINGRLDEGVADYRDNTGVAFGR